MARYGTGEPGRWAGLVLIGALATAAWRLSAAPLPSATLAIDGGNGRHLVEAEVAAAPEERRRGLMGRTALAADAGMLFLYREPQSPGGGFWMYQTLLPLDIAFLDQDGRILAIRQMVPCKSREPRYCPVYPAGVAYRAALEVNHGYFEARGVGVGDRVALDGVAGWDSVD